MAPAKVVYWAALVPAYLGVNRSDRAADALAKVEALEPDRPRTRLLRGTARAHQGRMADALAEFQAAAAASRVHRPAALRGAGMCLMNLGRPDQAVEAFAAAVHLSSGAEGWRLLGDALGVLGRPQDAADAYAEAVRHDPADTAAAYKLADALLRGLNRPDEAGRILAPRLADFRGERQVAALDLLGWACHLAGRPAEAIRHLDQAVALRPDAVPILVHLAAALEAAGDQRRAAETWRRVKALSPDHPLADDRLRALETKPQR
jgi:tetratricopeptide (TPR) repeat protein